MKIEVWSDFVCPFCYMGKRILEKALSQFAHRDQVEVVFKSFELNPNEKNNPNRSVNEVLAEKYGMSIEEAQRMNEQVAGRAKTFGLTYNIQGMKQCNTFDAHRLFKLAETKGKGVEMTERLFKAYFTDGLFLGGKDVLISLAKEVGLDEKEAQDVLATDTYAKEVRSDESEARSIGVQGVPFFVVNQKYAISGAQPLELFIDTLNKVWKEEQGKVQLQHVDDASVVCTDEGCALPEDK